MKRVTIKSGQVALVSSRGIYKRVLQAGSHWLWPNEELTGVYSMAKPFVPPVELNILLQDHALAAMLDVVEVQDNELALHFENGIFRGLLHLGRQAFWRGVNEHRFMKVNLNEIEIPEEIGRNLLNKAPLTGHVRKFVVEPYEKALLFVEGERRGVLPAGTHYYWRNHINLEVQKVDTRQLQLEVSGQEILTKDKAALRVNFFVQYRVADMEKALQENRDFEKQLYILVQLALREYIGKLSLDELLESKDAVAEHVARALEKQSDKLGVHVNNSGIRDIILPGEVREIMNKVLIAQKTAEANTITRREETASTRSLLNTAKLMEENTMLFKLKEMEYVEKIADKINNISLSGGNLVVDQLRDIFSPKA